MAIRVYQCVRCAARHFIIKNHTPIQMAKYGIVLEEAPGFCVKCKYNNFFMCRSIGENIRLNELILQQKSGIIEGLKTQVTFKLTAPSGVVFTRYTADFVYRENDKEVIEDSKGDEKYLTDRFKLIKAYFKAMGYSIKVTNQKR